MLQTLLFIPGFSSSFIIILFLVVGALVGAFVGAFVGEFVGGFVGGSVGGMMGAAVTVGATGGGATGEDEMGASVMGGEVATTTVLQAITAATTRNLNIISVDKIMFVDVVRGIMCTPGFFCVRILI